MTSPPSPTGRDLARQLLARAGAADVEEPAAAGAALQRLCTRMSENLRVSVGDDGFSALVARALRQTEAQHPVLKDVRRIADSDIHLDGVVASIDRHGLQAVTAALESLLAALVDLLSSLIGADMVLNLLDWPGPLQAPNGGQAP